MDKIEKFLRKLPGKDLDKILKIINKLEKGNTESLDIKKLSGHKNIFRLRMGTIRIIFLRMDNKLRVVSIERKNDKTYKF